MSSPSPPPTDVAAVGQAVGRRVVRRRREDVVEPAAGVAERPAVVGGRTADEVVVALAPADVVAARVALEVVARRPRRRRRRRRPAPNSQVDPGARLDDVGAAGAARPEPDRTWRHVGEHAGRTAARRTLEVRRSPPASGGRCRPPSRSLAVDRPSGPPSPRSDVVAVGDAGAGRGRRSLACRSAGSTVEPPTTTSSPSSPWAMSSPGPASTTSSSWPPRTRSSPMEPKTKSQS